jgi:hypothetical protein
MSEQVEPMVIPLDGIFRSYYNDAKDINVEHPSSNLFLNLIQASVSCFAKSETPPGHAENRKRIDHVFEVWDNDYSRPIPILVKESKAIGKGKKEVETQTFERTKQLLEHHNLTHLYGIATIGTAFRAWKAFPGEKPQSFDDEAGYVDVDSLTGARIWNDLMRALQNEPPQIQGSIGERSDEEMEEAAQLDPQSIQAILDEEEGAAGSTSAQWVEVRDAHMSEKTPGRVTFRTGTSKLAVSENKWVLNEEGYWTYDSEGKRYWCYEIKGKWRPKGKGKAKR